MFIIGTVLQGLAMLVNGICTILYWLIFARIIISWLPVDPFSSPVQFLNQVTDPILEPLRNVGSYTDARFFHHLSHEPDSRHYSFKTRIPISIIGEKEQCR